QKVEAVTMKRPLLLSSTALGLFLIAPGGVLGDDPPKRDVKPLFEETRKLVEKYYPKADVTLKDDVIRFEYKTRKFMIHEALLDGSWQEAREQTGPDNGGIMGDIEIRGGRYGGQAAA